MLSLSNISRAEAGATLIEVMVATLVLGVGLLGILSLQGRSLQYSQQAYVYSQASILAQDMAERIRANPEDDARSKYQIFRGSSAPSSKDCSESVCTAAQIATWDLSTWLEEVEGVLPDAEVDIRQQGANNNEYQIQIFYEVERDGDSGPELYKLVIRV